MSTSHDSYVSHVLFARPVPGRVLGETARRWRRLANSLFDPYRPELYYMRGPGPKWRAKHARGAGCASWKPLNPNHQRVSRNSWRRPTRRCSPTVPPCNLRLLCRFGLTRDPASGGMTDAACGSTFVGMAMTTIGYERSRGSWSACNPTSS